MQWNVDLFYTSLLILILCSTTQEVTTRDIHVSNYKQPGPCGLRNFECDSGQCISEDNLCDGRADCSDNSDETWRACSDIRCPRFIYRCNYGACVKARAKCDGFRDCLDGSDEASCNNNYVPTTEINIPILMSTTQRIPRPMIPTRPLQPINCLIPNYPENGMSTIGGRPPEADRIGDAVPPFSVLITTCEKEYEPSPLDAKYSVCANGIWTPLPPTCSRFPQMSSAVTPTQCHCYC